MTELEIVVFLSRYFRFSVAAGESGKSQVIEICDYARKTNDLILLSACQLALGVYWGV